MSNKKMKRYHNKCRNRYIYIGDYDNMENIDNDNLSLQYKIDLLSNRLKIIEDVLSSGIIIKAKPVMSIIMGDKNCMDKFNKIYKLWIDYISTIANSSIDIQYNVENLFWHLDKFIFHHYFHNHRENGKYIYEFSNVDFKTFEYTNIQLDIIKKAFTKDRNEYYNLLYPHNKEFISTLILENRIFLFYFENELYNISNNTTSGNNFDHNAISNKMDFQFSDGKLHPALSLNNNVIGNPDLDIIKLNSGENIFDFPNVRDKRQLIIQNMKPLYNSLVDLTTLNKLNSTLYKFNPILLNLSLIIYHAMLHLKIDIENGVTNNIGHKYDPTCPHDALFLKEYINFTPSALYGHPMIPPLTLPCNNQ